MHGGSLLHDRTAPEGIMSLIRAVGHAYQPDNKYDFFGGQGRDTANAAHC